MEYRFYLSRDWNVIYNNLQNAVLNYDLVALNRNLYELCSSTNESIQITTDWSLPTLEWAKNRLETLYNDLTTSILPESSKKILTRPTITLVRSNPLTTYLSASSPDESTFSDLQYVWEINGKEYNVNSSGIEVPYPVTQKFTVRCKTRSPSYGLESLWSTYENTPVYIDEPEAEFTYITPQVLDTEGYTTIQIKSTRSDVDIIFMDSDCFLIYGFRKTGTDTWTISGEFLGSVGNGYCTFLIVVSQGPKVYLKKFKMPTAQTDNVHNFAVDIFATDYTEEAYVSYLLPAYDPNQYIIYVKNLDNGTIYPIDPETERFIVPSSDFNDNIVLYIEDLNGNVVYQQSVRVDINNRYIPYIFSDTLKEEGIVGFITLDFDLFIYPFKPIEAFPQINIRYIGQELSELGEGLAMNVYFDLTEVENTVYQTYNFKMAIRYKHLFSTDIIEETFTFEPYNLINFELDKQLDGNYKKVDQSYEKDFTISSNFYKAYINYNNGLVFSFPNIEGDEVRRAIEINSSNKLFIDSKKIYNFYKDNIYYIETLYNGHSCYNIDSRALYILSKDDLGNTEVNVINAYPDNLASVSTYSTQITYDDGFRINLNPFGIVAVSGTQIQMFKVDLLSNKALLYPIVGNSPYTEPILEYSTFAGIDTAGRLLVPNYDLMTMSIFNTGFSIPQVVDAEELYWKLMFTVNEGEKIAIDFTNRKAYRITYDPLQITDIQMFREPQGIVLVIQDDTRIYTMECKAGTYSIDTFNTITIEENDITYDQTVDLTQTSTFTVPITKVDRYVFRELPNVTKYKF